MKDALYRPELQSECEMCSICGRGVGMVYDTRELKNPHPFMCFICELRFPPEQWETDEQGLFFNLSKNGVVKDVPRKEGGGYWATYLSYPCKCFNCLHPELSPERSKTEWTTTAKNVKTRYVLNVLSYPGSVPK